MNCRKANERMSAWLDGELAPREAEDMRRHLASCASCNAEFEQLQQTVRAVKDLPVVPAPEGFHARVMADIESDAGTVIEKRPAHIRRAPRWRMLWPAAAALLVAVVLALMSDRPRPVRAPGKTDKPAGTGAETYAPENEATTALTHERMRATDIVSAPPQPAFEALDSEEARPPLAERAARAPAAPEGAALKKEALLGGGIAADTAGESSRPETGLALARDETEKTADMQVWTVLAKDPGAALARLDAVALERRWKIPSKRDLENVKSNAATASYIDLSVLRSQLPALSEVIEGIGAAREETVSSAADAKSERKDDRAKGIPRAAVTAEGRAVHREIRRGAGEEAEPVASPALAVRVRVYFRAPETVIVPPAAAATQEVEKPQPGE